LKKIIFILLVVAASLFGEYKSQHPTKELLNSNIPIVDIRTPQEWRETGILKGAIPITFFDSDGNYNIEEFLKQLNKKVDTKKPFALICRTGSRTSMVAPWLAKKLGYNVINLEGGMIYVTQGLGIKPINYIKN
jgi:rhodanese-related sulfurtransferase